MKNSLDPNDREFLAQLNRLDSGTVQEICAELGVTATAVRQRLTRLLGKRLVDRKIQRSGRGRPKHVYHVTETGLRQLGENYADLAIILWRELKRIEEPDVRRRIVDRVRQALVERHGYSVGGTSLLERMRQLQFRLQEQGFDVDLDTTQSLPILREHHCPYPELAQRDSSICELEQEVFEEILGSPVALTQCCLDGHSCCEFEPKVQAAGVD